MCVCFVCVIVIARFTVCKSESSQACVSVCVYVCLFACFGPHINVTNENTQYSRVKWYTFYNNEKWGKNYTSLKRRLLVVHLLSESQWIFKTYTALRLDMVRHYLLLCMNFLWRTVYNSSWCEYVVRNSCIIHGTKSAEWNCISHFITYIQVHSISISLSIYLSRSLSKNFDIQNKSHANSQAARHFLPFRACPKTSSSLSCRGLFKRF